METEITNLIIQHADKYKITLNDSIMLVMYLIEVDVY